MGLKEDIVTRLNVLRTNSSYSGNIEYGVLSGYPSFIFGFNPGIDRFYVAIGQSSGTTFDWRELTTNLAHMRGEISGIASPHDLFRIISFSPNSLPRLTDFLLELVSQIDSEMIDESFEEILNAYEDTFRKLGDPISQEEARGLQGELIILENLIDNLGQNVTESWVGPSGSLHDFENDDWHIEAKESMLPDPIAHIHPRDQLAPIGLPFNLVMVSLRSEEEGETLPQIIGRIRGKLGVENNQRAHFEEMISCSGYSDEHSDLFPRTYSSEIHRLTIDEETPVLYPAVIDNRTRYDDFRWRLRWSDYAGTSDADTAFFQDPTS